jgi:hypothetical protein
MKRIDFDLIVNELLIGLKNGQEVAEKYGHIDTFGPTFFGEYRTIGFTVPRQMGKSYWAVKRIMGNEKALMVVRDASLRNGLLSAHRFSFGELEESVSARLITANELKIGIAEDTLPELDELLIDEASHWFHFARRAVYEYLWDKKSLNTKLILVG